MKVELENVSYIYGKGTSNEVVALSNINLEINQGEYVGIIGHTGSGKSTLIQLLNGLEKPWEGRVLCDKKNIFDKNFDLRRHRCNVGMVFQYPEHQLFESTILRDVAFGPKNKGYSEKNAINKAEIALEQVGIDRNLFEKSPFELSGGQKRRVAIAGILAMEPEILILDEPTAGLDPVGRDRILQLISDIKKERNIGVVLVSHSMEDVAKYADRLIVMDHGKVAYDDAPKNVFRNYKQLEEIGLCAPEISYIMHRLKEKGMPVDDEITSCKEAAKEIEMLLKM